MPAQSRSHRVVATINQPLRIVEGAFRNPVPDCTRILRAWLDRERERIGDC